MRLTVGELVALVDGRLLGGEADIPVTSFAIDSRASLPGACFFALVGERDGHDFVEDAFTNGAVAAVVSRAARGISARFSTRGLVQVSDPLRALAALGAAARDRSRATVVGVTGSVGKTATKDLTAGALRGAARVHASPASFNNEAGLPLTLLSAPAETDVIVAEMGARRIGDLRALCDIARPRIGAVTNIGVAHSALLGGPVGVARAKGELLEVLPADGLAVLNGDDPATPGLASRTGARVLTVGREASDVVYHSVSVDDELRVRFELDTPWGASPITLGIRGEHQAPNAAMAATIALALDVPLATVADGLATTEAASGRMELHRSRSGIWVLDDSYNANPVSTAAALRALARLPADHKIAVLGEMLELGEGAYAAHLALGRLVNELELDAVVVVGPGAHAIIEGAGSGLRVIEVADPDAAAEIVAREAAPGDAVLVKASRAVGLERVVGALLEDAA